MVKDILSLFKETVDKQNMFSIYFVDNQIFYANIMHVAQKLKELNYLESIK